MNSLLPALSTLAGLQQYLHSNVVATLLIIPYVLIVLDLISGLGSAIKQHVFTLKKIADLFGKNFLYYLVAVGIVSVCYIYTGASVATNLTADLGLPALSLYVFASIVQNLTEISPELGQVVLKVGAMVGLETSVPAPDMATPTVNVPTLPIVRSDSNATVLLASAPLILPPAAAAAPLPPTVDTQPPTIS